MYPSCLFELEFALWFMDKFNFSSDSEDENPDGEVRYKNF